MEVNSQEEFNAVRVALGEYVQPFGTTLNEWETFGQL